MQGKGLREQQSEAANARTSASIGLPTDSHSSFLRGAAAAPALIRAALALRPLQRGRRESGWSSALDILLDDAGDLAARRGGGRFRRGSRRRRRGRGRDGRACRCSSAATIWSPFRSSRGSPRCTGRSNILHFDAHPDLYDDFEGDPLSHASPFARIMERGLARRLVQVGIRTLNRHCREQAERFGVEIVEMRAFDAGNGADPRRRRSTSASTSTRSTRPSRRACRTTSRAGCRCATCSAVLHRVEGRSSAPTWSNIIPRATSTA